MKFLAAPAFLVTTCCLITTAQAADFTREITPTSTIITISGEIWDGDEKKFESIIPAPGRVIVKLNSKGGYSLPASLIGFIIREKGYETRMEGTSICYSACTLIFFAGVSRHMDPNTFLGFHTGYDVRTGLRNAEANKKIAAYLTAMGAPQQIIELQPKADPCCVNYVSREQAKAWGVLKERSGQVVTDTDVAMGPQGMTVPGALLDALLERARLFRAANGL